MSRPGSCKDVGRIAGLYDLEQTIGRGHFAVVRLARHVFTGERVAVKVIDKSRLDAESRSHLFQEVRCMKLVQHPNIVRLYEVIDTQSKLYLILELADGGDMYDYIMKHDTGLSESLGRKYFLQIVRAISYCHQLHVVHRDLKPENVVFFEKQGIVKLTDFGFSNRFLPGQKLETSCGSLAYSAPEILLGDSYDPTSVDVWSLGAVLYMLVCGYPPFQEVNDSETLTMIMDCKYRVPDTMSEGCRSLIGRMLQRDPSRRATLPEIESDAWLTEGKLQLVAEDPAAADQTPLVARQQLPEQDHLRILQKIVSGGLGTREQVVGALERNDYNYITATYYLLAERRLRAMQDGRQSTSASTTAGSTSLSVSAASGHRSPSPTVTDGPHASRLAAAMARPGKLVPSQLSTSVSTSTVGQVCAGGAVGGESTLASSVLSSASPPATPSESQCQLQRLTPRRLHAVRSSPQLLEIHEEEEDESGGQRERQEDSCGDDDDEVEPPTTKLRSRLVTRTLASPGRLRRLAVPAASTAAPPSTPVAAAAGGVRQRRRPGGSGGVPGSCSIPHAPASCSSSDASDDDEQLAGDGQRSHHHHQDQQHAQLVTPSSTPPRLSAMPRRDSHDDSSDSAAESGGVMGRLSRGVQRRLALRAARGGSGEGGSGGQGGRGGGGGQGGRSRYRARSACGRLASDGLPPGSVTASRSLNCISELHVLDLGYCSAHISAAAAAQVCVSPDHVTTVRVGGPNVTVLSVRAGGVIGYPVSTAAAGDAPPFVWAVG